MIRRCRQCGLCVPPEASACGYCGCTECMVEPLSPDLARKIIAGALAACAVGLPITISCGHAMYAAPCNERICPAYSYDAGTDGGDADAEASNDGGGEAGESDAADAAPD